MRILKEPLLHFILIGGAIFGWFYLVSPQDDEAEPTETIVVDEQDIDLLAERFSDTWKRPPNEAELSALVDATVREEVLVREARKLGLDRGDQVIRARLAQKMDFLTNAIASSAEPETHELQAFLNENSERFTTPRLIALDQVFLGESPSSGDVADAKSRLEAGEDWSGIGTRTLLPRSLPLSSTRTIDANFGKQFSDSVGALATGQWAGPIQSGYGQHLVRVTATQPASLPPLDQIRDAVLLEWRRATGEELARAQYEKLAANYQIVAPGQAEAEE